MKYIIKLYNEPSASVYVSIFTGDPGRTYDRRYAKRYKTEKAAKSALTQVRSKYGRPFVNAEIIEY